MTAAPTGLHALAQGVILSPFTRIRRLLEGIEPGMAPPIEMMVGEPREVMPGFVTDRMVEAKDTLAKYPPIRTSEELRKTIGAWIERRYGIAGSIDALRHVHPLNGSREGLFFAILPAVGRKVVEGRPVVLLPNPMSSVRPDSLPEQDRIDKIKVINETQVSVNEDIFTFDRTFGENSSQEQIYESVVSPLVNR